MADINYFVEERVKTIRLLKDHNLLKKISISDNIETYFGRTYYRLYIFLEGDFIDNPIDQYVSFELRNSHLRDMDELEVRKGWAYEELFRFHMNLTKVFDNGNDLKAVLDMIEETITKNNTTYEENIPYYSQH